MLSIQAIREHLLAYSVDFPIPLILALLAAVFVVSSTGVTIVHQALLPAFTGYSGPQTLLLAIVVFSLPVWGLVLPYALARERPYLRTFALGGMFLLVVGSYLLFFANWWGFLQLHSSWLLFEHCNFPIFDDHYSPQLFVAVLKDVFLCAFLKCVLWNVVRNARNAITSVWPGES